MTIAPAGFSAATATVELTVSGMTCAACAAKITKRLNKLDGVSADVNYALGTASVTYDPMLASPDSLVESVAKMGFTATPPDPEDPAADVALAEAESRAIQRDFGRRLLFAFPITAVVVAIGMRHGFSYSEMGHGAGHGNRGDDTLGWISLELTAPVVAWAGWPFHRAALANLRHRTATMDTLVSMGTLAAFLWSAVAVLRGSTELYFEVAAAVT
ncbi:MAG TPA: cation transporter, partial [Nonomuraea sp.]|nr:cation transporter [Nonomuraea sp.]